MSMVELKTPTVITSKESAAEKGLKYYYTGIPCKQGHLTERRLSTGGCLRCEQINGQKNYNLDPVKAKARREKRRELQPEYARDYWHCGDGKWSGYRARAKRKGFNFAITRQQFDSLTSASCFYCGGEGGGIDRKDSHIGYVAENCLPCCYQCNSAKKDLSQDAFLDWVKRISKHQESLNVRCP